jgi:3-oxoacyl-[acyl-carrier-protein] synthase-3
MAFLETRNVRLRGISACVPARKEYNRDYDWITEDERKLLIKTTGIACRHVAREGTTTSDLCAIAAEKLLHELGWKKEEIDLVVFVTQSRDYFLPSTALILHQKLGLSKTCAAFDMGLGCSGYVYGLSSVAAYMSGGSMKKALLLAGDISTVSVNKRDKSTYPLFGDCGTATALEYDAGAGQMVFNLQSDGTGYEAIIMPDGCLKQLYNDASYVEHEVEKGVIRSRRNLWLNGLDVFNFSVREAPPNITAVMNYLNRTEADYDYLVMHQANLLMNETIRKKLKIPAEKVPYSLADYGNTSSASIPLTIVSQLAERAKQPARWLFSGFGVGLSWGCVSLETDQLVCPPVIETDA